MSDDWYVLLWEGQEYGPCSSDQLRELARIGRLQPDQRLRYGATGQWCYAGEVDGLFPAAEWHAPPPAAEAPAQDADVPGYDPWRRRRRAERQRGTSVLFWAVP